MSRPTNRRQFLRRAALGTGTLAWAAACGGTSRRGGQDAGGADASPGADAAPRPDASGGACTPTTSDVLGPFFEAGAPMRADIAGPEEPGERLALSGRVVDAACAPLSGVLLDVWQADRDGAYHDAGTEYRLRGQLLTDADGRFELRTIRPGNYEIAPDSMRPAHIHVTASKPGHRTVTTQLYFAGDPFLPPDDGCSNCGSDDPARHIELAAGGEGWVGSVELVLATG